MCRHRDCDAVLLQTLLMLQFFRLFSSTEQSVRFSAIYFSPFLQDFYLGKLDIRDFETAKLREKELGLKRRLPKLLTEVVLKKLI